MKPSGPRRLLCSWATKGNANVISRMIEAIVTVLPVDHGSGQVPDELPHVAALVPESFIRANLFQPRLHSFISLTAGIFSDTAHPVSLALFVPHDTQDVIVYSGRRRVGTLRELEQCCPKSYRKQEITFNVPDGNLGLIALDNTHGPSIRFCDVKELADYQVKKHGRHITRLAVAGKKVNIYRCNLLIHQFR